MAEKDLEALKELTREIKKLGETTKELYLSIQGNEALGQRGFKHEIQDHGKRINDLEILVREIYQREEVKRAAEGWKLFKARISGVGAGAGATATALAPKSFWAKLWGIISALWTG